MQVSFSRQLLKNLFLWTHKEVDSAPHPVVGMVLQVRDAEKFPQALGFESLDPFLFRASKQGPCFTAKEEYGDGEIDWTKDGSMQEYRENGMEGYRSRDSFNYAMMVEDANILTTLVYDV